MRPKFSVRIFSFLALAWLAGLAGLTPAQSGDPMDWPNWRGPQQNSISTEKGLIDSWDPDGGPGSNLLWKRADLAGRSTPIVMRGKLYTIARDQPGTATEGEKVVCADPATGEIIWQHRFNVYLSEVPDTRVGWSSCVGDPETGRVYAQGVSGYFCCLEGDTGKVVWDRSLHEEFGAITTYGGRTNIPVIFEDTVLISAVVVGWGDEPKWGGLARPAHRFMAFDKATGELRWMNGTNISPYDTTYSTPTVMPVGGQQMLIFGSGDGQMWAMQPRTGKHIWNLQLSRMGINISPLVAPDGRVFISHSEENEFGSTMGTVVAVDGKQSGNLSGKELWRKFEVMAGKSSPLLVDERLYVIDDRAKLYVFDAKTGEQLAYKKLGTASRSTPLYADGKIYYCDNGGRWYILKPTEDGVEIIHRLRLEDVDVDGSPIVSHGRIYLPTSGALYCIGNAEQKAQADPLPPTPKENPISDMKAALLQLIPYDVLLAANGQHKFRPKLFNVFGQEVKPSANGASPQFIVDGPGTIAPDGTYQAPVENVHQNALITCKVGDLTGTARVRITPPLPWKWDFNHDENVPLTWIGGRVRYQLRNEDGEQIIVKLSELPTPRGPTKLGTRSMMFMGPTDLANYTVQADIMLPEGFDIIRNPGQGSGGNAEASSPIFKPNGKISDVGFINSGYFMTIRGQSNKLRIDSWPSHDVRTHEMIDAGIQPGEWYTMKFSVVPDGSTAIVRGKLWKRGETEPDKWTIEMVDYAPNLHGSPGLYGHASDAEIYLDNLQVTPN